MSATSLWPSPGEKISALPLSLSVDLPVQRTRAHLPDYLDCSRLRACRWKLLNPIKAEFHWTVWRDVGPLFWPVWTPARRIHRPQILTPVTRLDLSYASDVETCNCHVMGPSREAERIPRQVRYRQTLASRRRALPLGHRVQTHSCSAALVDARVEQSRRFPVVLRHLVRVLRAVGSCLLDKVEQDKVRVGLVLPRGWKCVRRRWVTRERPLAAVGCAPCWRARNRAP
jgi:hypothetical protein